MWLQRLDEFFVAMLVKWRLLLACFFTLPCFHVRRRDGTRGEDNIAINPCTGLEMLDRCLRGIKRRLLRNHEYWLLFRLGMGFANHNPWVDAGLFVRRVFLLISTRSNADILAYRVGGWFWSLWPGRRSSWAGIDRDTKDNWQQNQSRKQRYERSGTHSEYQNNSV